MIRVGPRRLVAMRYIMKNAKAEVMVNTVEQESVRFIYGSGEILPALEAPLTGLRIGDRKSFALSSETSPGLDQTFHFDVIIDDISWVTEDVPEKGDEHCGPGCQC